MEQITNILELDGKTIEKAGFLVCCEYMYLIFTDGTYSYIESRHYDDMSELMIDTEMDEYLQNKAGIMSDEEYKKICDKSEKEHAKNREIEEKRQYERLKEKYG